MKKPVFFEFLIILLAFGLVSCDNGSNGDIEKTYTVTIGTLTNGSITANPTSGVEGTEITLTVHPDNLYRLKSGSLKHGTTTINETFLKFNLPAFNVTVTAEFEIIPPVNIEVTQNVTVMVVPVSINTTPADRIPLQLASGNYSFVGSIDSNFSVVDLNSITYILTSINPNKTAADLTPFINANGELLATAYTDSEVPLITQTYYFSGQIVGSREFRVWKSGPTNFAGLYDNSGAIHTLPATTLILKKIITQ